jgi:hypothetical protein
MHLRQGYRMQRRFAILVVLFVLSLIAAGAAKADVLTIVSRTTGSGVTTSPCTGESLAFTSTSTSVFHFNSDPSGVSQISATVTLSGQATGLTSGTTYVFGGASHVFSPFDPSHPDLFPVTSTLTFVLVGLGPAPNLLQHQTVLLHFNDAGEPTVDFVNTTFECLG